ncbi:MAG: NTF2-like N-terminal transpeptidase domain-containing protein [Anaerolineae bacterium]
MTAVGLLALALAACQGISLPGSSSEGGAASILQIPQSPQDVAASFLDAWGRSDYDAMYALLSPQSQQLTSQPVFRTTYEETASQIGLQGVTPTFGRTQEQGTSAAVPYDLSMTTSYFGEFNDPDRTIRLVQSPNGWRVAWTPNDIFEGYSSGTRLEVVLRRDPRGNILDHNGDPLVEQDSTVIELYVTRAAIPDEAACLDLCCPRSCSNSAAIWPRPCRLQIDTQFPVGDIDPETYSRYSLCPASPAPLSPTAAKRAATWGMARPRTSPVTSARFRRTTVELRKPGYSSSDLVGRTGIEAQYESELAGESSRVLRVVEPGRHGRARNRPVRGPYARRCDADHRFNQERRRRRR